MVRQTMTFSLEPINGIIAQAVGGATLITVGWFTAKRKFNRDRIETADADANISAIGEWQKIVTDLRTDMRETITQKDSQITRLETKNGELTDRNEVLFTQNQTLTREIGGLKNQVEQLTNEVQQLNRRIGGVL